MNDTTEIKTETAPTFASPSPETITSEADMGMIKDFFAKAANTIVEAAGLRKDIAELRRTMDQMKSEIGHIRDQNRWLDEQLANVRKSRDDYAEQVRSLHAELDDTKAGLSQANDKIKALTEELDQTKANRDEGWGKYRDRMEEIQHLTSELSTTRFDRDRVATELDSCTEQVRTIQEQLRHVNEDLRKSNEEKAALWRDHTSLTDRFETVKKRLDDLHSLFTTPQAS